MNRFMAIIAVSFFTIINVDCTANKKIDDIKNNEAQDASLAELLFQKTVTPGAIFISNPPGDLDCDRLISGKQKYWKFNGETQQQLFPKNLIISDWTLCNNEYSLLNKIKNFVPEKNDNYKFL